MGRLHHKRGRPSKYRNSLKSEYWTKVKKKVRLRDDFKCRCCNSTIRLETHHITYYVNGQSITSKELQHLKWLITLCETCH
jgi:5-methylcytosine-specific restriction endonuclease McrA